MAQFYGTIQGSRGKVSRFGDKNSGFHSTCNGAKAGVSVRAEHHDIKRDGLPAHTTDVFVATFDAGSYGYGYGEQRAGVRYYRNAEGRSVFEPDIEFMEAITDSVLIALFRENPDLLARMRKLVFVNLDKLVE